MKQTPAHSVVNMDLFALIPPQAERVVEVGCMHGQMGRMFLQGKPQASYVGIDIDPDYAQVAAAHCTRTIAGDIETLNEAVFDSLFPSDCWIFGDCLEHLRDPWAMLQKVRSRIAPGGALVACIPNAQHWSVQWRLMTGQFRYEDSGLMDRTHLRWLTRITMLEMFAATGWRVDHGVARYLPESPLQASVLEGVRAFAQVCGANVDEAVRDATAFQYVFRLLPA